MLLRKVVEKIKTHFLFNNFFSEDRTVCTIMSKDMVKTEEPQMTCRLLNARFHLKSVFEPCTEYKDCDAFFLLSVSLC